MTPTKVIINPDALGYDLFTSEEQFLETYPDTDARPLRYPVLAMFAMLNEFDDDSAFVAIYDFTVV